MSFFFYLAFAASSLVASGLAQSDSPPAFTTAQLAKIRANAVSSSTKSWEIGTMLEALLELEASELAVFGATSVPVDPSKTNITFPEAGRAAIDAVLAQRGSNLRPFAVDGSAADPASIGVANTVLGLLTNNSKYSKASAAQLDHLLHHTPRAADNLTISHRQDEFQAWSDYMYMVPPFICYYGATVGGDDGAGLTWFAHQQALGYRRILQGPESKLWRHIMQGNWSDPGLWATGNGWAAMGMLRVEQCISKSQYADNMRSEVADLRAWTKEILNATWAHQEESGLVRNYFLTDAFEDAASTALLTAATYRYSHITDTDTYISHAEKAFRRLIKLTGKDGWLDQVTDPYSFGIQGKNSPEAQSFLLLLQAAGSDYYDSRSKPGNVLADALLQGLNRVQASTK